MTLWLNLAGWRVRLICTPPALAEQAGRRYAAFTVPPAGDRLADWTVEVHAVEGAPAAADPAATLLAAQVVRVGDEYLLDAPEIHGRIVIADWQAVLRCGGRDPLGLTEYFLRIACALFAYHAGGLLIHAAGLQVGGRVHLFVGQSGSGKSTVVALSPGARALSDDLILLRPNADGWQAHGTPFWNQAARERSGETAQGPVVGMYKLIQAADVYLEPLPPAVAVAELVANCPVVNGITTDLPGLVSRCGALARAVPLKGLHFRKESSFWQLIS